MEEKKQKTVRALITNFNKSNTRLELLPMELAAGWPAISIRRKQLCVTIPFFKSQYTKERVCEMYPLSYGVTFLWETGAVIEFSRYSFTSEFKDVDYGRAAAKFPHEAIAKMKKQEYCALRDELFACYDELLASIAQKKIFEKEARMKELFGILMEPEMLPYYRRISSGFFDAYCREL